MIAKVYEAYNGPFPVCLAAILTRMKPLGQGWQYIVYDLGNGRIKKIKRSPLSQYFRILSQSSFRPLLAFKRQRKVNKMESISNEHIKRILSSKNAYLFGNPVFITKSDYEQDKVESIATLLKKNNFELCKKMIDDYCTTVHITWKHAFSDCVFKLDKNNGVDRDGRVIQIDFGELTVTKKEVEDMIRNKKWINSTAYRRLYPELKEYYEEVADREFTLEKLDELWGAEVR